MADQILTQEYLHSVFTYLDGKLYWKNAFHSSLKNQRAGSVDKKGYRRVTINGKEYREHRLIYAMHNNAVPDQIDHIDGNKANNLIENLRPTDARQNQYNRRLSKANTSGVKNVHWSKTNQKWIVAFKINGKDHRIGAFDDLEVAKIAAVEARTRFHGTFANHG